MHCHADHCEIKEFGELSFMVAVGVMTISIGEVIILVVAAVAIIAILATVLYKGCCYIYNNRHYIQGKIDAIVSFPQQTGRILVLMGFTAAMINAAMTENGQLAKVKERDTFFSYVKKEGKVPQAATMAQRKATVAPPNSIFVPDGPKIEGGGGGNGKGPKKSIWELVLEEIRRMQNVVQTMPKTGSPLSHILNVFK